jgi:hypothetical protein
LFRLEIPIMLYSVAMNSRHTIYLLSAVCLSLGAALLAQQKKASPGYTDTATLPGQRWHVHDPDRPHPNPVTPGKMPGEAPSDAIVLFDGHDLSRWMQNPIQNPGGKPADARWKLENGYFECVPRSGDLLTRDKFGDVQLHIEWSEPAGVKGTSQERGNSGVLLMNRYEIQVLDSYKDLTYADGQAGALYGQWPPLVNPIRPPGEWQAYDIVFEAPRFEGEKLLRPAYATVFFNGVLVHNRKEILGTMVHRSVAKYTPHGDEEPLTLQDHVWIRRLHGYDQPER